MDRPSWKKIWMTDCQESRVEKMEKTKIWRVGRNDRLSKKEVEGERGGRNLEDL